MRVYNSDKNYLDKAKDAYILHRMNNQPEWLEIVANVMQILTAILVLRLLYFVVFDQ